MTKLQAFPESSTAQIDLLLPLQHHTPPFSALTLTHMESLISIGTFRLKSLFRLKKLKSQTIKHKVKKSLPFIHGESPRASSEGAKASVSFTQLASGICFWEGRWSNRCQPRKLQPDSGIAPEEKQKDRQDPLQMLLLGKFS